jgi:hypothetical protein
MSVQQMALVWGLKLPHNQAWVLMAYADHADHDGEHVYPGIPRIAWKTGYSERQIQRIVRELEAKGLMELVSGGLGGSGNLPLYRLTLEKGVKKSPFKRGDKKKGDKLSSIPRKKGDSLSEKGDKLSPPYNKDARAEPSFEPSLLQPSLEAGRDRDKSKENGNGNEEQPHSVPIEEVHALVSGFIGNHSLEPHGRGRQPVHANAEGEIEDEERLARARARKAELKAQLSTGGEP